ncbi:MAG: prepilin-type N-terminal cleavage/methylation domain-containing protein [Synergistaceae bacterium]|nr:prepilin-type N-terminal cleavage/methylation domain-containing protein [Synergistaceae bacterium]
MKTTRKGFTLIELLIVVAIIAALAAMMAVSSADAIDTANANAILSNLQSMKVEAYDMYMNEPAVAALTTITNDSEITITEAVGTQGQDGYQAAEKKKVAAILGERIGRIDLPTGYKIVGGTDEWYVVYTFQTNDSAQVKSILKDKASTAGLYGGTAEATTFTAYYANNSEAAIALRVR